MRPEPARKAFARGRRLAKRPPDVQQTGGVFPGHRRGWKMRKSRRNPAAFLAFRAIEGSRGLEPLRVASATVIHARAVAAVAIVIHAALESMVPPAFAGPAFHMMRQHGKPPVLAVVQRLVVQAGGIAGTP